MTKQRDPLRPARVEQRPAQVGRTAGAPAYENQRSPNPYGLSVSPWSVVPFLLFALAVPCYLMFPVVRDAWRQDAEPSPGSPAPRVTIPLPASAAPQAPAPRAPPPSPCTATYACCLTVLGTEHAASCTTFQNPQFPPSGCVTALDSLKHAARAQGRSCAP